MSQFQIKEAYTLQATRKKMSIYKETILYSEDGKFSTLYILVVIDFVRLKDRTHV